MTLRIPIAALGLLLGVAVSAVSAEEPGLISTINGQRSSVIGYRASDFGETSASDSAEFIEASVELSSVVGRRSSVFGEPSRAVIGLPAMVAQRRGPRPLVPADREKVKPPTKPHRAGELDCANCHVGKHQGVLRMYLGMGGRGTPMIPSHMFQVRVACVACHIVPKEEERAAGIVGQTFRPSQEACVNCHGEQYRGMLQRWMDTLNTMQETVAPKLAGAHKALKSADPENPKVAQVQQLVADAEFNIDFVTFAKGVHNVFYAADLLKLANTWLDDAFRLLGTRPVKTDDVLVRGRYCGVLCHQQAGVPLPVTVKFGEQEVPHGRHITEFGAVCTGCHSAEVHKAVTATPATCVSCHHSPQNERCESCHRRQAAFYRGEVKTDLVNIEPNVMASVVSCTGCHDLSTKHSRKAAGQQCLACHDEAYMAFVEAWTTGLDEQMVQATKAIKRAEAALRKSHRAGRKTPGADRLMKDAQRALAMVKRGSRPQSGCGGRVARGRTSEGRRGPCASGPSVIQPEKWREPHDRNNPIRHGATGR